MRAHIVLLNLGLTLATDPVSGSGAGLYSRGGIAGKKLTERSKPKADLENRSRKTRKVRQRNLLSIQMTSLGPGKFSSTGAPPSTSPPHN